MRIFKIIVIALSIATTQFFAWSALYFLFYADFGRAFSCIVATFFIALMGTDKLLADIELCLRNGRDGKP